MLIEVCEARSKHDNEECCASFQQHGKSGGKYTCQYLVFALGSSTVNVLDLHENALIIIIKQSLSIWLSLFLNLVSYTIWHFNAQRAAYLEIFRNYKGYLYIWL